MTSTVGCWLRSRDCGEPRCGVTPKVGCQTGKTIGTDNTLVVDNPASVTQNTVRTRLAELVETYQRLLARGLTKAEITALVRSRQLVRLRRGAFVPPGPPGSPEARHLELLAATVPTLAADSVVSHISAGVLHEVPVPFGELHKVHVTRSVSGRITKHVHRHQGRLPAESLVDIKGYAVTSLPRTAADLARWLAYADGVAVLDATLRRGLSRAELEDHVRAAARRPGNERARRAVAFANPLAESAGESRSRVLMTELGLPEPVLQQEFRNANGEVDARVDFDWPELGACGEYDGRLKYGRLLRPGQSLEDVILFEKQREQVLRDHGRWMIRWSDTELQNPKLFHRVVSTGLAYGSKARRS